MVQDNKRYLEQAAEYWKTGRPLDAGRLIFQNLPPEDRPKWAAGILRLVLKQSGIDQSLFSPVLDTADNPHIWENGHRVFDDLRHATLALSKLQKTTELTNEQRLQAGVLSLAELVAKVTYNATNPSDEFDEDSGWWIAVSLRRCVDHLWPGDDTFARAASFALTGD